jgi:hypothetical protein
MLCMPDGSAGLYDRIDLKYLLFPNQITHRLRGDHEFKGGDPALI